jgi:hypothetical protein
VGTRAVDRLLPRSQRGSWLGSLLSASRPSRPKPRCVVLGKFDKKKRSLRDGRMETLCTHAIGSLAERLKVSLAGRPISLERLARPAPDRWPRRPVLLDLRRSPSSSETGSPLSVFSQFSVTTVFASVCTGFLHIFVTYYSEQHRYFRSVQNFIGFLDSLHTARRLLRSVWNKFLRNFFCVTDKCIPEIFRYGFIKACPFD